MSFQYYPMLKYRKCPFNIIPLYYTENVLSILSYSTVLYYTENVLQYYSYSTVFYRKCAFNFIPLYYTENILSHQGVVGWKRFTGKNCKIWPNRELAALFLY